MSDRLDLEHLRQWIGTTHVTEDEVTPRLVASFLATFDDPAPDLSFGSPVPAELHFCLAPPIEPTNQLGEDGHLARGTLLPPVPLPLRMWAGSQVEYRDQLRLGDRVERRSTVEDVTVKHGRSGILCFVDVKQALSTARGPAITQRDTIVFRDRGAMSQPSAATVEMGRPKPMKSLALRTNPVQLFRFSALTFNGHRIHYDRRYCTEIEGYPGLVVHGPLQAVILHRFAASLRPSAPAASCSMRAFAPLFDDDNFTVNAVQADDGFRVWIEKPPGIVTMEAAFRW